MLYLAVRTVTFGQTMMICKIDRISNGQVSCEEGIPARCCINFLIAIAWQIHHVPITVDFFHWLDANACAVLIDQCHVCPVALDGDRFDLDV